ncbi:hypothetical protein CRG98_049524, partial [Punica granatum]
MWCLWEVGLGRGSQYGIVELGKGNVQSCVPVRGWSVVGLCISGPRPTWRQVGARTWAVLILPLVGKGRPPEHQTVEGKRA